MKERNNMGSSKLDSESPNLPHCLQTLIIERQDLLQPIINLCKKLQTGKFVASDPRNELEYLLTKEEIYTLNLLISCYLDQN
jgi:hypothetical protein